tara:strand:+ start:81 stop:1550 length:1470 start_codon:yes stop_codon:yes gene_type:complete
LKKDLSIFLNSKCLKIFFLGFSSGLPILLVFSTLSVWLVKAGIERSTVTLFSWAGFAYAFKYLWSPIVDNFELPVFSKLGHRRGWLLFSQLLIMIFIIIVAFTNPNENIIYTAISISFLAFFSATQDISVDAFRIESAPKNMQGPLSSMYIAGYRISMIVSGAGSLWLASYFGGENYDLLVWRKVYLTMSMLMIIGILTVIYSNEPTIRRRKLQINNHISFIIFVFISILSFGIIYNYLDNPFQKTEVFLSFIFSTIRIGICFTGIILLFYLSSFFKIINQKTISKSFIEPINNFINKYGKFAVLILTLIAFYRIADVVMGVMANIFYIEKGYTINDIATYSKFFGLIATIIGGFLGGYSAFKIGTMRALFIGAIIAALSNILFAWLASVNTEIRYLIGVIIADNISSGFAGAAFVVYISNLTSIKFTATQYALFSSIMLFFPKLIAGYAGSWVDVMGYQNFFLVTALLGVPVIFLISYLNYKLPLKNK